MLNYNFYLSELSTDANVNELGRWSVVLDLSREIFIPVLEANQSKNNNSKNKKIPVELIYNLLFEIVFRNI